MTRYVDESYLEFVRNKVRDETPSREAQITAMVSRTGSATMAQLCFGLRFDRETIEKAVNHLVRRGECAREGNLIKAASRDSRAKYA
jgi:hypothetical protein